MPTRRTVVRALLLLLAAVGLWVFLQPVVVAGIWNAGNALGLAASVTLAVVVLVWSTVARGLRALARTRRGRAVLGAGAVALGAGVLWCGALSAWMLADIGEPDAAPGAVVVLGCRVEGDTPSQALQRRIDTAADYLLGHPEVPVVVSGGKGAGEQVSEAEAMRRGLVDRGVAEDRILLEDRSTSTLENLTNSAEILDEHGLGSRVVVVTEGYHLHRALEIADRVGLDADGLAASSPGWLLPTSWVREWVALTLDAVRR